MIGTDSPDAAGYSSATAFLHECATGRDVHTVVVDGEIVVADRELRTADYASIKSRAGIRQEELIDTIA